MLKPYPQSSPVPNNLLLADATDVPFANDSSASNSWANWLDRDTKSFLISFGVHLLIVLSLSIVPIVVAPETLAVLIQGSPPEPVEPELTLVEEITYSDTPSDLPGANSFQGEGMALSQAAVVADVSEVLSIPSQSWCRFEFGCLTRYQASGWLGAVDGNRSRDDRRRNARDRWCSRSHYLRNPSVYGRASNTRGMAFRCLGSLTRRRQEIRDRFDRIYQELGIVRAMREKKKITKEEREAEPLLTSIYSFGQKVNLLTKNPTADLNEITEAIDRIENDISGLEFVFSAVYSAAEKYKGYRVARSGEGPARNVLFVVVTDERGNDSNVGLEKTIGLCRKHSMPVYVMGVPAPSVAKKATSSMSIPIPNSIKRLRGAKLTLARNVLPRANPTWLRR